MQAHTTTRIRIYVQPLPLPRSANFAGTQHPNILIMAALFSLSLSYLSLLLVWWAATASPALSYYKESPYSYGGTSPTPSRPPNNKMMNVIDGCWRKDPNWATNRRKLADCAIGFGKYALGGKLGATYVVTDASDDPANPKPGTLRYGVIQTQPLWIVFAGDMVIQLKNELIMTSFKTIDGRGARVEIAYGPCITIQYVTHVIIHGISIHHCTPGKPGLVRSSTTHLGHRQGSDGDAISVFGSSNVWIDHCSLSHCYDGLIDVIHASTAVTISNNYFSNHDKVMLFGHRDSFVADKAMKVTVVFNHFGEGLVQRMPRVRLGYAHVANNMYDQWEMYAIGGSANPTILSQGNYFQAPSASDLKQVTKREAKSGWKNWKWRSSKDLFLEGAYFVQSGWGTVRPSYTADQAFSAAEGMMVPFLTADAGPLNCVSRRPCTT
ncbi:hypothetical protein Taro_004419 [Colocasia esculenta]|uniref:Pectate lyase n=1 Tax=Colocasia esculenta TaxID=4460 RepID=A0A843TK21_COLES|nr:hypothetical protein [Colocasia esculenta]